MNPTVVLATIGSLGDLHPFIALGRALQRRGATVVVACVMEYREKVERAGLGWRGVRPSFGDLEQDLGMTRAQLTRAVLARNDFLLRRLIMPHLRASYEDMADIVRGADLVLTSSLAFGARLAAERHGTPWIALVLQPLMFLSAFDPPELPMVGWVSRLVRGIGPTPTRWLMQVAKRAIGAQLRPVQALRREIGLPPSRLNPLFEGQYSALGAIGLYSALIGAPQPDFPVPTDIVGFSCFDSDDGSVAELPLALAEFLGAGDSPLVFTLGSLIVNNPGSFYRESLAAARRLKMRAVLLVGEKGLAEYAGAASSDIHICGYAPHSLLFPRAAAIVHQGGIGTLAQGLRSGRPELVVPFYADQRDNAARALRLGVARSLAPRRYTAAAAHRELHLLINMPAYAFHANRVRTLLAAEDGASRGATVIWDRLTSLAVR